MFPLHQTLIITKKLNVKGLTNTRGPGISNRIKTRQEMKKHGAVPEDQLTPQADNVDTIFAIIQKNVIHFMIPIGASITRPRLNARIDPVSPISEKPSGVAKIIIGS
jgi:hypothetical protein